MATVGTIQVPGKTFRHGATDVVGPFTIPAGITGATLEVDRTVTGGLNARSSVTVALEWDTSPDGGTTWVEEASMGTPGVPGDGWVGGTVIRHGVAATDEWSDVDGISPGDSIRLQVTVTGSQNVVLGGGNSTLTLRNAD